MLTLLKTITRYLTLIIAKIEVKSFNTKYANTTINNFQIGKAYVYRPSSDHYFESKVYCNGTTLADCVSVPSMLRWINNDPRIGIGAKEEL